METLATGRKSLLSKNGYRYAAQRKTWVGPNNKEIPDNSIRRNTETWLENTIYQQQGQVIR